MELGAGTGFLSLALVQEGVEKVFAAEGDEDAWENLTQNVGTASQLQPVLWNWERDPAIPDEIPVHSLHLIVGSDLVYPGYYNERALAELIRRLVDLMSPAWHVPVLLLLCAPGFWLQFFIFKLPRQLNGHYSNGSTSLYKYIYIYIYV